jgi:hypothetical protein
MPVRLTDVVTKDVIGLSEQDENGFQHLATRIGKSRTEDDLPANHFRSIDGRGTQSERRL